MSASAILIFHKNKILLFHRDNTPTITDPDCWSLVGGQKEKGETHLQTIKRECKEEVSFAPKNIKYVGKLKTKEGLSYVYASFVDDKESKMFKHGPGEGQGIAFFTLKEISKLKLPPILKKYFSKYHKELQKAMLTHSLPNIFTTHDKMNR